MQVRCTVQLAASFAAAAVGAIILLLMMTLAVDVFTHSIHMLRPWFSSMLRIIIIVVGGLNMIRIAVVSGGPRCAPQLLPNEGSQALLEGVHWRSLASNFGDFDDFGLNFVNFSCTQQSDSVKTNAAYDHYYT
tara:strand:+ start:20 stop:418 length:399 start_codon:yes stop_codon:yes gene_type:complete